MYIGLLTNDIEYATRLVSFVRQEKLDHRFCFQLFTTIDNYIQATHRNNCQMIIVEEVLHTQLMQRCEPVVPVLLLTERLNSKKEACIFKFRPASYVLEQIRKHSGEEKRSTVNDEQTGIIVVSSYFAGSGKTTAALAIANELAREGKKVFYLSLEHWVNEDIYTNAKAVSEANLSHFYYLQQTNPQLLNSWLTKHCFLIKDFGCETLLPFLHPEDRLKLTSLEAIEMLQSVRQSGLYHYVVVELEAGYDEMQLAMLELANIHFIVGYADMRLQNKMQQYLSFVKQSLQPAQLAAFEHAVYLNRALNSRQEQLSIQLENPVYLLPHIDQAIHAQQAPLYRAVITKCLKEMLLAGDLVS